VDSLIRRFDAVRDDDLMLVEHRGIAYQANMKSKNRVAYDDRYWDKVMAYEDSDIARKVNAGRCDMLARHLPQGAKVLDIGAGTGAFVKAANKAGFVAKGFDVLKRSIEALMRLKVYGGNPHDFDAVTMWDSLEHMDCPELKLKAIRKGAMLFVSIPIFEWVSEIRKSKHYRPGEHFYYPTRDGFVEWMALWGFRLVEESMHEVDAGREQIGAFAFVKDLPDYHDHVAAYTDMHASRYYGSSAVELHLDTIAKLVLELKPMSILDYGCGRSDLVAHFWRDGRRRLGRYDPAIPTWKSMPAGQFDVVLLCDVMEHIPMSGVDVVLTQARAKAETAILTISTKLARAKLPDGRNAHVTLLRKGEWMRWIADYWGSVREIPSQWEHELIVLAGAPS
jgi:2-polyprenyl-3-methyl-5-hydroxy-6-metoxy-1,4-benzoquinol methylase